MTWLAMVLVGCGSSDGDGPRTQPSTEPIGETGETGLTTTSTFHWSDYTESCTTPAEEPAEPGCTYAPDDWMVMCDWPGTADAERSWVGHFTAFDSASAIHFEPTDGTEPPVLIAFASGGSWMRAPDLVAAGEVTLHMLGGCGDSFAGEWLTVITDATGQTLLVVGQTDLGSVAGWSVEPGTGAGGCPMYVAPQPSCQACRSNVPLHVTGPGFDAEAWQSQSVESGGLELLVGSAWIGSGLLCSGQSVDLYNWIVTPPSSWTGPG